jgi:hypothetical protein
MKIINFFLFLTLCSSFNIYAHVSEQRLAAHPTWLKLGHYKNANTKQSYIISESFFLAEDGKNNPLSELNATIKALNNNPLTQCKYPARYSWLKAQNVQFLKPKTHCPQLEQWRDSQPIHSVSLIFASGYMSNPASLYGHLLLKLNRSTQTKNKLLDYSLNYGAHVPDNENGLVYIANGIFGGYEAGFSDQLFYRHQHNYGEIELRDLWEYTLNLSKDETTFIANHLWEILGAKFDYFFADENCAFHIAQIIELIIGDQLNNSSSQWLIPATIFSRLNQATHNNKNVVKEITFTPSRHSLFIQLINKLTANEASIAKQIYFSKKYLLNNRFLSLEISAKKRIIETLFELVQLQQIKKQQVEHVKTLKKALIIARLKLPVGKEMAVIKFQQQPPHKGQKPSNYSISTAQINNQNNVGLGFRLSYFDSLASDIARIPFSNLEMFDAELSILDSNVYLNKLHLLDLESFNPAYVKWPEEQKWSWQLNAGFERQHTLCANCKSTFLMGGMGQSFLFNDDRTLLYTLVNGYVGDLATTDDFYTASMELGIMSTLYSDIKLRASYETFLLGNKNVSTEKIEISIPLHHDFDIRISYKNTHKVQWKLKFNYYWH